MSYDMSSLLQAILLVLTTLLFHIGITNPNSNTASDYMPNENIGLKSMISVGPAIGKLLIWLSTLCQLLCLLIPMSTVSNLLPLTFVSVVGYILMIIGGSGRIWCYKTLGTFFTFHLTIRRSHKLIKTGPYAYVRHPSYTFAGILLIGMVLIHRRLTNFFLNEKWTQIVSGPAAYLISCAGFIFVLIIRVSREEKELKKTFGKEWSDYASKTKRLIPHVF